MKYKIGDIIADYWPGWPCNKDDFRIGKILNNQYDKYEILWIEGNYSIWHPYNDIDKHSKLLFRNGDAIKKIASLLFKYPNLIK